MDAAGWAGLLLVGGDVGLYVAYKGVDEGVSLALLSHQITRNCQGDFVLRVCKW